MNKLYNVVGDVVCHKLSRLSLDDSSHMRTRFARSCGNIKFLGNGQWIVVSAEKIAHPGNRVTFLPFNGKTIDHTSDPVSLLQNGCWNDQIDYLSPVKTHSIWKVSVPTRYLVDVSVSKQSEIMTRILDILDRSK